MPNLRLVPFSVITVAVSNAGLLPNSMFFGVLVFSWVLREETS